MVKFTKKKKERKTIAPSTSLGILNQNHGFSICFDDESIDVTNSKVGPGLYLARDISRLTFPLCKKLVLSIPNFQLKELRPKMPKLETLGIIHGTMRKLYLPYAYLKDIKELDLTDNEFECAEDLSQLKAFKNLTTLILKENPIAYNATERIKLDTMLPDIKIEYN